MALLWRAERGGHRYEVRAAGRTRRLYTDGVLHTEHNPRRVLTHAVWDLLVLPAFALDPPPARVLVLGVGGGAAVRLLRHYFPHAHVTAVERDPVHLSVARRFFGLRASRRLALVEADARAWVRDHAGPPFDLVIDDLFGGRGEPERAVALDPGWMGALAGLVGEEGALVVNCASRAELGRCAWRTRPGLRRRLPGALALSTPREHNAVGAFLRRPVSPAELWRALEGVAGLCPRSTAARRRYRIVRLAPDAA
ncbi:MAG TPA: hypothetical protein ENK20_12280 [Chromatiales bacterium]|nr:hypothetical protein [Chromatiales bacterium]